MSITRFITNTMVSVAVLTLGCSKSQPSVAASNASLEVEDWRHGVSDTCLAHHTTMRTEVVPGLAGNSFVDHTRAYYEARDRLFPHAGIEYGPDMYSKKSGKIYVCADCVQARKEWRKQHP